MKTLIKLAVAILSVGSITSCVPAAVVGGTVVGTSMTQERSAGDRLDDNIIAVKIRDALAHEEFKELFTRVSVAVHEGRVLLTGSVKDLNHSVDAANKAWKVDGVKEVINEIEVSPRTFADVAKDSLLATSVRSKLLLKDHVHSNNYKVEVNNGIVYLLGVAKTRAELNAVIKTARSVKGVKKVINHVLLISDNRRK